MINKNILKHAHHHGFNERELYDAYKLFFGTLVSEPRLKIINLLRKKKKNVTEIILELNINQTIVSHNLARLKKCGFVEVEIDGKFRYYKLNEETAVPLIDIINKHMSEHCIHILREMKDKGEKIKGGRIWKETKQL